MTPSSQEGHAGLPCGTCQRPKPVITNTYAQVCPECWQPFEPLAAPASPEKDAAVQPRKCGHTDFEHQCPECNPLWDRPALAASVEPIEKCECGTDAEFCSHWNQGIKGHGYSTTPSPQSAVWGTGIAEHVTGPHEATITPIAAQPPELLAEVREAHLNKASEFFDAWAAGLLGRFTLVEALANLTQRNEARVRVEALEEAARVVKQWKFMACSDAEGLVAELRALAEPAKGAKP